MILLLEAYKNRNWVLDITAPDDVFSMPLIPDYLGPANETGEIQPLFTHTPPNEEGFETPQD